MAMAEFQHKLFGDDPRSELVNIVGGIST